MSVMEPLGRRCTTLRIRVGYCHHFNLLDVVPHYVQSVTVIPWPVLPMTATLYFAALPGALPSCPPDNAVHPSVVAAMKFRRLMWCIRITRPSARPNGRRDTPAAQGRWPRHRR